LKGNKVMVKVKIIDDEYIYDLEKKVNEFIKDKRVISISYAIAPRAYGYTRECCILYEA
jgi:hypothetical protein